jgi:tetratricopeptide (TPR) repeat protein
MLDLPSVPSSIDQDQAGLSDLDKMKELDHTLWTFTKTGEFTVPLSKGTTLVRHGIAVAQSGATEGLDEMRQGIRLEPNNLVLANAYRMVVFKLRRDFLAKARREAMAIPHFPPELDKQPITFFEELDRQHPSRETKLNLALAWVDEMLLFPALEIKAPSSVQSVDILSSVLEHDGQSNYVPALYARGLNHLHRPARLVWPESIKAPRDAAVQDIGKCVAIGRRLGVGSARLQATLAMNLGDSYVKTGKLSVARSWWQIAQNLCRDADFQAGIHRRYEWQNEEILDRLEEELDRGRSELDHPMTDLALMWN